MKNAISQMTSEERAAFEAQRALFLNLAVINEILAASGISQVAMIADAHKGRCTVSPDADWVYNRDPDDVEWPKVSLRQVAPDGKISDQEKPLRDALAQLTGDIIEDGAKDWRARERSNFTVLFEPDIPHRHATLRMLQDGERSVCQYSFDPVPAFLEKDALLETDAGSWYRIESAGEARAAGKLGQPSVGFYFDMSPKQAPGGKMPGDAYWYVLISLDGPNLTAPVALAAQPEEGFCRDQWPGASHVRGRHNENAYPDFAEAIEALAAAEGLHIEPNLRGAAVEPEADNGPSL